MRACAGGPSASNRTQTYNTPTTTQPFLPLSLPLYIQAAQARERDTHTELRRAVLGCGYVEHAAALAPSFSWLEVVPSTSSVSLLHTLPACLSLSRSLSLLKLRRSPTSELPAAAAAAVEALSLDSCSGRELETGLGRRGLLAWV